MAEDTGEHPVIGFPAGEAVTSSSAGRSTAPVGGPRALPIIAIALAVAGAALAIALGPRSATAALLGWLLAAPLPAIALIAARRILLERSASTRFAARPADEPLLRAALVATALGALATSLVLGPWFGRW